MPTPTSLPTGITAGTSGHVSHSNTVHDWINKLTQVTASTKTVSYVLVLSDAGECVEMNSGSATTLTVPPNSSVGFAIGTVIEAYRMGAGTVTLTAGAGVTLTVPSGSPLTIRAQGSSCSIRKRATDEWVVTGDVG